MKKTLAFDIGGTFVKWGILDENYQIIKKDKFPSNVHELGSEGLIIKLANFANELNQDDSIEKVSISIPGATSTATSTIVGATQNMPGSQNMNVKDIFNKICELPLKVGNDVNVAMMAEHGFGAAKGYDNAVLVTIGTGIGGGLILDGKLFEGNSWAGEVGRQIIKGEKWENNFSSVNFLKKIQKVMNDDSLTGEDIFDPSFGNEETKKLFDEFYDGLAIGISNLINILNPEIIIISGGVTSNDNFNISRIEEHLKKYVANELLISTKIVKSTIGNDAALYGGVALHN